MQGKEFYMSKVIDKKPYSHEPTIAMVPWQSLSTLSLGIRFSYHFPQQAYDSYSDRDYCFLGDGQNFLNIILYLLDIQVPVSVTFGTEISNLQ